MKLLLVRKVFLVDYGYSAFGIKKNSRKSLVLALYLTDLQKQGIIEIVKALPIMKYHQKNFFDDLNKSLFFVSLIYSPIQHLF